MRPLRVAVATCQRALELDDDRVVTVDALARRGVDASSQVWNDQTVDWSGYDLVIVRSTWDYTGQRDAYLDWASSMPRLANPFDILKWNTDKRYLEDLARAGVATVPTTWIAPGSPVALPEGEIVIKPAVGAGALGSGRFGPDEGGAALAHATSLLEAGHTAMVQPYVEAFDTFGERGLVFLGGQFSHAIHKPALLARRGLFVFGTLTNEIIESASATTAEMDFAEAVLDVVPGGRERLLYARVDMVPGPNGVPVLVELEVTEPHLYFAHQAGSADRFAEAVEEWLAAPWDRATP